MLVIPLSEQEILSHISRQGPKTGYELGKETKYSEKTSYQAVKSLEKRNMLRMNVVGKTRAGMDMKEYHLTILGLSYALSILFGGPKKWNPVIKRWAHLIPLVLEKWDLFVGAGVEDLAWRKLEIAIGGYITPIRYTLYSMNPDNPTDSAEIVQHNFYHPEIGLIDRKERLRWVRACAKDSDIKKYLTRQVTLIIAQHEALLKVNKTILQILQKS